MTWRGAESAERLVLPSGPGPVPPLPRSAWIHAPRLQWMAQSPSSVTHRRRHPSAVGGPAGLPGSRPHSHRRNTGTRARCVRSLRSAPPAWRPGGTSGRGWLIRGPQDPGPAQAHQELCPTGLCPQAAPQTRGEGQRERSNDQGGSPPLGGRLRGRGGAQGGSARPSLGSGQHGGGRQWKV